MDRFRPNLTLALTGLLPLMAMVVVVITSTESTSVVAAKDSDSLPEASSSIADLVGEIQARVGALVAPHPGGVASVDRFVLHFTETLSHVLGDVIERLEVDQPTNDVARLPIFQEATALAVRLAAASAPNDPSAWCRLAIAYTRLAMSEASKGNDGLYRHDDCSASEGLPCFATPTTPTAFDSALAAYDECFGRSPDLSRMVVWHGWYVILFDAVLPSRREAAIDLAMERGVWAVRSQRPNDAFVRGLPPTAVYYPGVSAGVDAYRTWLQQVAPTVIDEVGAVLRACGMLAGDDGAVDSTHARVCHKFHGHREGLALPVLWRELDLGYGSDLHPGTDGWLGERMVG